MKIVPPLCELAAKIGQDHAVHAYRRGATAIGNIATLVSELGEQCGFVRRHTLCFASRRWYLRRRDVSSNAANSTVLTCNGWIARLWPIELRWRARRDLFGGRWPD